MMAGIASIQVNLKGVYEPETLQIKYGVPHFIFQDILSSHDLVNFYFEWKKVEA